MIAFWLPLAVLLLVQPLMPLSWPLWGAHAGVVSLLLILTGLRCRRGPAVQVGVPAAAAVLALLSLAVTLLVAGPQAPQAEMRWTALTGLLDAAFFLLALCWMPGAGADAADVRRSVRWLAALLFAACAEQLALGLWSMQGDPDARLQGTLGNPNVLGAIFAATALLALSAGFTERRRARTAGASTLRPMLLAGLLAVPLVWGLLLTRSRGAAAALLLTLLLLAVRWRKWKLILAVVVAGVLLVTVPNPLQERLFALRPDHAFSRVFVWHAAAEVALAHPLGIGPAGFKNAFLPLAWDPVHPWLLHQRAEVGLTHNVFLTLAVEWGALAALAALLLAAWAIVRLLRSRGGRDDPLRLGATLGAAVLFLELQVDGLEQNPLAFTIFLLLAAAALSGLPRGRSVALSARTVAALALVLGVASGGLVLWRGLGLAKLHKAQVLAATWTPEADPAPVRAALEAAAAALPGELSAPSERAAFEARVLRGLFGAAGTSGPSGDDPRVRAAADAGQRAAAAAIAADGTDPDPRRLDADIALLLWRRVKHRSMLPGYVERAQAALALDPLDVEGHFELAEEAQRGGLDELARQEFDEVFRLEPDHVFAWYLLARLREAGGDKAGALYAWDRASEAILNARIKAQVDTPRSREFFEGLLKKVDQAEVLRHIAALRQELFS